MASADRTPAAAAATRDLRREVARVRRRARAVLLAGAAVAALAADVWYDVVNFGVWRLSGASFHFPHFFFVAVVVFSAYVLRRTGTLRLSALLDERFALKQRLEAAFRFERHPGVPADVREAQALETLRAVDFARLRSSFRFRPWGSLVLLVAGAGCTAWLMYRYPESFVPRNVAVRPGRVVFMAVKSIGSGSGGGADAAGEAGDGHPQVALVAKDAPARKPPPGAETTGGTADGQRPPGGENSSDGASAPHGKPAATSVPPGTRPPAPPADPGQPDDGKSARLGPDEGGGTFGRPVSLEETEGISAPTARPASGLAVGAADLRGPDAGSAFPALPFVRLLGGGSPAGALFDPESLNIVLETYPPKYREHLEAYFKALQAIREERHGS